MHPWHIQDMFVFQFEFKSNFTTSTWLLFREKCKIMYTDTNSLIYHIDCDDVYDIMKRDISRFDTSDYSNDNAYGIQFANKKIPGFMKENNDAMTKFIGLTAKMYFLHVKEKKNI